MKARPIHIDKTGVVRVPLARDGKDEAVIDLEAYNELMTLGVYQNWQLRGGNVGARGPRGLKVLIGRVLTNARPGQRVVYRDGNPLNLRRGNLDLSDGAFSINHDRAQLGLGLGQ
ncbi:hypothetical protein ACSBOB_19275 [Mesorhizobium sp. ASY16-5R]|uniref:hypothetical protein n=1 Tax=Mesorhizobium sp. ASY16-5R TaxID=3445772 RepID=UPI003FA0CDC1